ncbi:gamma-glutamyltranspeptidase/glutathione hydrolase [Stackebrandtia albiflava]|uniref:Gamma-glutamyltranspeptidase/glutathione hydrolase n=1 Tax=Stackebrandtia albiflava TaxID=406432 RepID=A0A562V4T0_9ACTN|nr:gamma-glutamyltransferase [Stackebrandtia albiflava]TWJ12894.1 gamma-glutamyltranspeptidase/glutathione hydrolase [Stackebrandtia albiflava]
MSNAGVAAGHPATVEAGVAVLADGGTAADAAIAAVLTSCVAETVMTGLGGGGFATYYDAKSRQVSCLDFFVSTPGLDPPATVAPVRPIDVDFGGMPLEFAVGAASVAVPGVPAGCRELHHRFGRLPWRRLIAPAIAIAERGAPLLARHAAALPALAAALLPGDGGRAYAPDGKPLTAGRLVRHPGLADTLRALAETGTADFYHGDTAARLVAAVRAEGGALSAADLAAYRPRWLPVTAVDFGGRRVIGRRDRADTVGTLGRLAALSGVDAAKRPVMLAEALSSRPDASPGDTTNISVLDAAGNACAVTTTLGVGSGVWPSGTGVHLNSMLGEGELRDAGVGVGDRMHSMMCPSVVLRPGADAVELAIGAAGASRIRTALVHTLVRHLLDGEPIDAAIAADRWHVVGRRVICEAPLPGRAEVDLRRAGYRVTHWHGDAHYFGGVSAIGPAGGAGDPRRDGCVGTPSDDRSRRVRPRLARRRATSDTAAPEPRRADSPHGR